MLKTTSLGRYWQENAAGSSFTRVRCISTGAQATPRIYGSVKFHKTRAYSVPDTSCKKLLKLRKTSAPFIEPVGKPVDGDSVDQSYTNTNSSSDHSLNDLEMPGELGGGGNDGRLLICTLDTEQNERNLQDDRDSQERTPSLAGSVETVTTTQQLTSSVQSCHSCGNCLEYSDMVVVFDTETYHMRCFNCGQCDQPVDPSVDFLVLDDGSPLCSKCSPVCHCCEDKIVSGHVNVLNKDFHEGCLKCSVCKKVSEEFTSMLPFLVNIKKN